MRYLLYLGALSVGLLLPAAPRWGTATIAWPIANSRDGPDSPSVLRERPAEIAHDAVYSSPVVSTTFLPVRRQSPGQPDQTRPISVAALAVPVLGGWRVTALAIAALWALVVLILCVQRIGGRVLVSRLRRGAAETDASTRQLLEECRREVGLERPVEISVVRTVGSPVTLGGQVAHPRPRRLECLVAS